MKVVDAVNTNEFFIVTVARNIIHDYGFQPDLPLRIHVVLPTDPPFDQYPKYSAMCILGFDYVFHIVIKNNMDQSTMLFHMFHELAHYITRLQQHDGEFTECLYKLLKLYEQTYEDYSLRNHSNGSGKCYNEDYTYTHDFLQYLRNQQHRNIFQKY